MTLTDPYKAVLPPKQGPATRAPASERTTPDRILLDEHASNYGRCDRCEGPWPCQVVMDLRYRSAK